MENMPKLFDVDVEHPDEIKSRDFITSLRDYGFIDVNMIYLKNYIDADIGIALAHVKNNYRRYVIDGDWSEEKFRDIVLVVARDRRMLIPSTFLRYGMMYDDGKLTREINIEKRKYVEFQKENENENESEGKEEISSEEQKLLDYLEKHGGLQE